MEGFIGCIQPARYGESDMGFYFRHLGYTRQPVKNSKTTADVGLPDNQARRSAVVCQRVGNDHRQENPRDPTGEHVILFQSL